MFGWKARRQNRQVRAVLNAMEPFGAKEEAAMLAAIADRATDITRRNGRAGNISAEDLALLAAYEAATIRSHRVRFQDALGLTESGSAVSCARLKSAAQHVASRQGRGNVLAEFAALEGAERPDHAPGA